MARFSNGFFALSAAAAAFFWGFGLPGGSKHAPRVQAAASAAPHSFAASQDFDEAGALSPPQTFSTVLSTVRRDFCPQAGQITPSATRLTYAALEGMLQTLRDPYTVFWTPDEYRRNMEETSGDFVGIGTRMDTDASGRLVVMEVVENSPAARKGLLPGDIITALDGKPTAGQTLEAVTERMRGKEGAALRLTVERRGKPKPFELALTRAVVHQSTVEWRMQDEARKIGYIKLEVFNEHADEQFAVALSRLEKQGMQALIFDLRDNPGGLLNSAQDVASRFIKSGPVVWVQEKNGRRSSLDVIGAKHRGSRLSEGAYPLVVLVNGDSASASEIVSGAIKDYGVGTLLGKTTYGKGLVQTIIPLDGDTAVKITTQHYFTPKLTDINKRYDAAGREVAGGIKPDIDVEYTDKEFEARQSALRENPKDKRAADRFDPQMQSALAHLRPKVPLVPTVGGQVASR